MNEKFMIKDYEGQILGAVLTNPDLLDAQVFRPAELETIEIKEALSVAEKLWKECDGEMTGTAFVRHFYDAAKNIDSEDVVEWINNSPVSTEGGLLYLRDKIEEERRKREACKQIEKLNNDGLFKGGTKLKDYLPDLKRLTEMAEEDAAEGREVDISVYTEQIIADGKKYAEKPNQLPDDFLTSGIKQLDRMTNGIEPCESIIVTGDPKAGKSSFALQVAIESAMKEDVRWYYETHEMSEEMVARRMLMNTARFSVNDYLWGQIGDDAQNRLLEAKIKVDDLPITINQPENSGNVYDFIARVKKFRRRRKIDAVVLDYMQLLDPLRKEMNMEEATTSISDAITKFCAQEQIPVIMIAKQNANGGIFGSKTASYNVSTQIQVARDGGAKRKITVSLCRSGPGGSMEAKFVGDQYRFYDFAMGGIE